MCLFFYVFFSDSDRQCNSDSDGQCNSDSDGQHRFDFIPKTLQVSGNVTSGEEEK